MSSRKREFPILLIGRDVVEFKRRYKGSINTLYTLEDVRDLVSYYTGISNIDRILVIEDLSNLPKQAEGLLLKFVEESKLDLVFLSRYDTVSAVFLSRMKTVKTTPINKTKSRFLSASKGYKELLEMENEDNSQYTKYVNIMDLCPKLLVLEKSVTRLRVKEKLMSLLD